MPDIVTEDPIAEASGEEVVTEEKETPATGEETVVEEEAVPAAEDRIEKIVQGIKDKLDAPAAGKQPSQEDIRKAWRDAVKKETGMSDQQIDYMEGRLEAVTAPLYAKDVFNEWKSEKGDLITPELEKGIKEYLKNYPANQHTNKILLDNVFYMELGKQAIKNKNKPAAGSGAAPVKPAGAPGRKIVPITPAPATGLNGGGTGKSGAASLSADELKIASKMRMTPEEYAQAKTTVVISELKKK